MTVTTSADMRATFARPSWRTEEPTRTRHSLIAAPSYSFWYHPSANSTAPHSMSSKKLEEESCVRAGNSSCGLFSTAGLT